VPVVFSGIRNLTVNIFTSPVKIYRQIGQFFQSKNELVKENKALRKKVGDLSLEISRLEDVSEENKRLSSLLDFKKGFGFRTVSAEVIARGPENWTGSFVIDKGIADGIKGQAAVCSSKGLLGKVAEAGKNTSFVLLVTHPNFKAGGVIRGSRINGVVVGTGGGSAKMMFIPMDADVKKGSIVTTSDLSKIFPKGILIGEVLSVHVSKTGLYKYAMLKPFAKPFVTEEVLCILGEK